MSGEVETVLERRRLRRQVGLWRGLAILAGVLVLIAFAAVRANEAGVLGNTQIARVTVEGMILDDRKRLKMLEKIARADNVKGVIVYINSPGGTTTGGEGLYKALRELSERKPVVAQFGTVAASAAYMAGLGTDRILARENTITGSVGVIMQWPNVSGLLDKIGVRMNQLKSGELKAEPNPFEEMSPAVRQRTMQMIEEGQRWFVNLVERRRKIVASSVPGLLEGAVFSGRTAKDYKLIDAIGAEDEARAWMVKEKELPEGIRIVDWKPSSGFGFPGGNASSWLAWMFGAEVGRLAGLAPELASVGLDGMLSVWQPPKK
ncbi:MAG: signal peptide peptidase SppA [Pseudomonadota bacterium]